MFHKLFKPDQTSSHNSVYQFSVQGINTRLCITLDAQASINDLTQYYKKHILKMEIGHLSVALTNRNIPADIINKIKSDLLNNPGNVREIFSLYGIIIFDNDQLRYALRDPKKKPEVAISCLEKFLPTTNIAPELQTRLLQLTKENSLEFESILKNEGIYFDGHMIKYLETHEHLQFILRLMYCGSIVDVNMPIFNSFNAAEVAGFKLESSWRILSGQLTASQAHIESLIKLDYKNLSQQDTDVCMAFAVATENDRKTLPGHVDAAAYWESLTAYQRASILLKIPSLSNDNIRECETEPARAAMSP